MNLNKLDREESFIYDVSFTDNKFIVKFTYDDNHSQVIIEDIEFKLEKKENGQYILYSDDNYFNTELNENDYLMLQLYIDKGEELHMIPGLIEWIISSYQKSKYDIDINKNDTNALYTNIPLTEDAQKKLASNISKIKKEAFNKVFHEMSKLIMTMDITEEEKEQKIKDLETHLLNCNVEFLLDSNKPSRHEGSHCIQTDSINSIVMRYKKEDIEQFTDGNTPIEENQNFFNEMYSTLIHEAVHACGVPIIGHSFGEALTVKFQNEFGLNTTQYSFNDSVDIMGNHSAYDWKKKLSYSPYNIIDKNLETPKYPEFKSNRIKLSLFKENEIDGLADKLDEMDNDFSGQPDVNWASGKRLGSADFYSEYGIVRILQDLSLEETFHKEADLNKSGAKYLVKDLILMKKLLNNSEDEQELINNIELIFKQAVIKNRRIHELELFLEINMKIEPTIIMTIKDKLYNEIHDKLLISFENIDSLEEQEYLNDFFNTKKNSYFYNILSHINIKKARNLLDKIIINFIDNINEDKKEDKIFLLNLVMKTLEDNKVNIKLIEYVDNIKTEIMEDRYQKKDKEDKKLSSSKNTTII